MVNRSKKGKKRQGKFKSAMQWLWRLFTSVRLAVILLLMITGLSLLGALLIQVPPEIINDPQAYANWVETAAESKVGIWVPFLSALGLFDVFRSPWFIILCTLLMINILICTINRWSSISQSIRGGNIRHTEKFYSTGKTHAAIIGVKKPATEAGSVFEKIIRARGYRTRVESHKGNKYIAADKNRYCRLGTYFSHFSLILFVIAFVIGSYFGFRDVNFAVAEDGIREVGHDTTLSLKLISFTDEYYDNGTPKDYRSEVILYDDGKPVRQATIQVNHPLVYKGVRFYQSYFGRAMKMQVNDINGKNIFNGGVALDRSFEIEGLKRLEGFFDLPEVGVSVRLISPAVNAEDFIIPTGNVAVDVRDKNNDQIGFKLVQMGIPEMVSGLEFTFLKESSFSGFQVSRDPGTNLIWIASALFFIGMCTVLYFPYRQVWVISRQHGNNTSSLIIRTRAPRGFRNISELNTIVDQIKKELKYKY